MFNLINPTPTTYAGYRRRTGRGSIANQPHKHARAIARRQRQTARNAERQAERLTHAFAFLVPDGAIGITRRGRFIFAEC